MRSWVKFYQELGELSITWCLEIRAGSLYINHTLPLPGRRSGWVKKRLFASLPPSLSSGMHFFWLKNEQNSLFFKQLSQTFWDWSWFFQGHSQGRRNGPELQAPGSKPSCVRIIRGCCKQLWLDGKQIRSSGMISSPNVLRWGQICPDFPTHPEPH